MAKRKDGEHTGVPKIVLAIVLVVALGVFLAAYTGSTSAGVLGMSSIGEKNGGFMRFFQMFRPGKKSVEQKPTVSNTTDNFEQELQSMQNDDFDADLRELDQASVGL